MSAAMEFCSIEGLESVRAARLQLVLPGVRVVGRLLGNNPDDRLAELRVVVPAKPGF
jgi:hypothetical protein